MEGRWWLEGQDQGQVFQLRFSFHIFHFVSMHLFSFKNDNFIPRLTSSESFYIKVKNQQTNKNSLEFMESFVLEENFVWKRTEEKWIHMGKAGCAWLYLAEMPAPTCTQLRCVPHWTPQGLLSTLHPNPRWEKPSLMRKLLLAGCGGPHGSPDLHPLCTESGRSSLATRPLLLGFQTSSYGGNEGPGLWGVQDYILWFSHWL